MRRATLVGVESARGVAATLVVFYHAALHLESHLGTRILHGIAHFGHAGVDFFFVLSGFIITYVHHQDFGRRHRLAHYAQRRFTRVFPFYWIVLAYTLADLWLLHRGQAPGLRETFFNILLLPHARDPVVGGAWTLVFEVTFYAAMAVTICNRLAGVLVMSLWAILIVCGFAGLQWPADNSVLRVLSAPFSFEFFLGIGAAYILLRRRVPHSGFLLAAGIAVFLASGIAEVTGVLNGFGAAARLAYGIPAVAVVLGLVELERSGALRVPRAMAALGQASYSVYLVHLIVIGIAFKYLSMLVHLSPSWADMLWLGLSALAVAGGVLASWWFERPSIRFFRRHLPA